jgi:hypothetical protein
MHAIWEQLKRVYGVEFTAVRIYSQLTALGATMADIPERRSRPGSAYLIPGHVGHRGAFHPSLLNIFVGHRYYGVQTGAALLEHGKRAAESIVAIGESLTNVKMGMPHGLPWFGWSSDTAGRFMQVADLAGRIPQIAGYQIDVSALYLLARPATPKPNLNAALQKGTPCQ